jgi:hypothetical protein
VQLLSDSARNVTHSISERHSCAKTLLEVDSNWRRVGPYPVPLGSVEYVAVKCLVVAVIQPHDQD